MEKKTLPLFGSLCLVPFIMVLGNSMLIPILPTIQKEMGITQFQAGLIITFFSVPTGILIPLAGFLSDQWGRRAILIPGIIIYGLGGGLAGLSALFLAEPYYPLLASRILMGIGAAGTGQLAMAATGDLFNSRERVKALGYIEAANGLGKVSSPIIGSTTALLAFYAPFFVYPLLSLFSVLAILFFLPSPPPEEKGETLRQYLGKLNQIGKTKGRELALALLTALNSLTVLFGILFYFSHIIEDIYAWQGLIRGLALASPVIALSIVSILNGLYLKNWRILHLILMGLGFLTFSLLGISLVEKPLPLITSITFLGVGLGLILPGLNTLFTSAVREEKRGVITSIYASIRFFGTALGPLLFSLAFTRPLMIFLFTIILIIGNIILLWFFMDDRRLLPENMQ